jgi:hypothetical protein
LFGVNPSLQHWTTPLLQLSQPQSSHNPLKIVTPVVLNFNPASFVSMMDGDVRSEVFLQSVLQIFDCRWHNAQLRPAAPRLPSTADPEQAGNQPLSGTHGGIATQNRFRSQELFLRRF